MDSTADSLGTEPRHTPEGRVLAIDVGAGTADILISEPGQWPENSVKLVVPSRTQVVAGQIRAATAQGAAVVFRGPTMGGGASTAAMRAHRAAGLPFLATVPAALSFADDPQRVVEHGVVLIDDDEAQAAVMGGASDVRSGDLELDGLLDAFRRLGVETTFAGGAVAVQDHGFSPHGSNRVFRFGLWLRALAERRRVEELFYAPADLPPELTRMHAAATALADALNAGGASRDGGGQAAATVVLPSRPLVLAGDTGPAALLGALPEGCRDAVLVNVGNGHMVCAVALEGRLAGVFEHHTGSLDGPRLDTLVRGFLEDDIKNDEVLADGGHGAVLAAPVPDGLPMLATGPHRRLLAEGGLPVSFPAPLGDAMLTGPVGLVKAFRHHFGSGLS
jgi:uncharacterized protein (DUF1786 family)